MNVSPSLPPTDVLLLDGESVFAQAVATCLARTPGVRLHVLADRPWTPPRFSRHCASYHVRAAGGDGPDDARRLRAVRDALRRTGAHIALPTDQPAIRWASAHRRDLAPLAALPPLPEVDAFDTVADKWRLAGFLRERGLPHPASRLAAAPDGRPAALAGLGFPVLLKARDGGNGRDIRRFDAPGALAEHLWGLGWETARFILQEFLPGADAVCYVLCERGRVLAHTTHSPLVPDPHPFRPSPGIAFAEQPAVLAVVERLMAALDWSGVANVDLRVGDGGEVHILEVNPRYGGSLRGALAAGVNFPALSCLAARGLPFARPSAVPTRYVGKHRLWKPWRGPSREAALAGLTLRESVWRDTVRDPLPDLYYLLRRTWTR